MGDRWLGKGQLSGNITGTQNVTHLEVDATEASLLHSEVCRDLQETRSVTFLLDGWTLVSSLISPWVASPPAGRHSHIIHFASFHSDITNSCWFLRICRCHHGCQWDAFLSLLTLLILEYLISTREQNNGKISSRNGEASNQWHDNSDSLYRAEADGVQT